VAGAGQDREGDEGSMAALELGAGRPRLDDVPDLLQGRPLDELLRAEGVARRAVRAVLAERPKPTGTSAGLEIARARWAEAEERAKAQAAKVTETKPPKRFTHDHRPERGPCPRPLRGCSPVAPRSRQPVPRRRAPLRHRRELAARYRQRAGRHPSRLVHRPGEAAGRRRRPRENATRRPS